ncbi:hypothetical protein N7524_005554 [Penicillium chrysogenum]|nr:hypothetical protein N7524_005554 [Penicillium chrysogenum]
MTRCQIKGFGSLRSARKQTTPHHSVTSFLDILICSLPESPRRRLCVQVIFRVYTLNLHSSTSVQLFQGQLGELTLLSGHTRGFSLPIC